MKKSKMIPFTMYGTKREILYYKLGKMIAVIQLVDRLDFNFSMREMPFTDECFELWFEYYGVGDEK